MNTAEAAKGNWATIFSHYGLSPSKRHSKEECPFCGRKGTFRISPERISYGGYICSCSAGNGFQLIQQVTGKQFAEVAKEIDEILGVSYEKPKVKPHIITAIDRWPNLSPVKGTDGHKYLNTRGINVIPRRGVKFGYEQVNGKRYGCLYSVAVNNAGEPCYVHQTFLDGDKKAEIPNYPTRKLTTIKQTEDSIAIRLDNSDKVLGIAEGIESALSAKQRFKVPVFSTINTAFIKRFKAPAGVERLMIFADSDKNGAGHAAAFECAHKNMMAKNDLIQVIVRWAKFGDMNENFNGDAGVKSLPGRLWLSPPLARTA